MRICNTGTNVIWIGTTSKATTPRKIQSRPGNGIQANAYAANAAIVIGITVDGIVTMRLFRNELAMPSLARTFS